MHVAVLLSEIQEEIHQHAVRLPNAGVLAMLDEKQIEVLEDINDCRHLSMKSTLAILTIYSYVQLVTIKYSSTE